VQGALTAPLRRAAEAAGEPELMVLWAGQAVKLAGPGEAGDLVRRWWAQAQEAARALVDRAGA
jgi:nitronate monooxygenase